MRERRRLDFTVTVFALALALFLVITLLSFPHFPEQVATHFDRHGMANGWMSRHTMLVFDLSVEVGAAVFVIGIGWSVRLFPPSTLNVPHAQYWRSPENYPRACEFLRKSCLWLAILLLPYLAFCNHLTLEANLREPAHLDMSAMVWTNAVFVAAVVIWATGLYVYFLVPAGTKEDA